MAFPVALQLIPGRGRGLITTRDVAAGEIVLAEEPLLLTVSQEFKDNVCTNCLCWIDQQSSPAAVRCQHCCQAAFCSPACQAQAAARPWVHATATCSAYKALPQLFPADTEQQNCLRFLIQAAAVKAAAAAAGQATAAAAAAAAGQHSGCMGDGASSDHLSVTARCAAAYQVLMSLVGEPTPTSTAAAAVLHPALCQAIGDTGGQLLTVAEVAALLSKEQLNCFGLLAPLHLQQHQHPDQQQQQQQQQGKASGSQPTGPTAAAASGHEQQLQQQQQEQEGDEEGEEDEGRTSRRLRGGALYPVCALLNHECLPNVARFDALDAALGLGSWPAQWPGRQQQQQQHPLQQQQAQLAAAVAAVVGGDAAASATVAAAHGLSAGPHGNSSSCCSVGSNGSGSNGSSGCGGSSSTTLVTMRALHALPAGTEVVISYVPLNWDLQDRQQQTQQVYGFDCGCPRCLLESSPEWQQQGGEEGDDDSGEWETDSGDGGEQEGSSEGMMEADDPHSPQHQQQQKPNGTSSSHQPQQQQQQEPLEAGYLSVFLLKYMCPRPGCYGTMAAVQGSDVCECSVCGALRSEAEFLAELQGAG